MKIFHTVILKTKFLWHDPFVLKLMVKYTNGGFQTKLIWRVIKDGGSISIAIENDVSLLQKTVEVMKENKIWKTFDRGYHRNGENV